MPDTAAAASMPQREKKVGALPAVKQDFKQRGSLFQMRGLHNTSCSGRGGGGLGQTVRIFRDFLGWNMLGRVALALALVLPQAVLSRVPLYTPTECDACLT